MTARVAIFRVDQAPTVESIGLDLESMQAVVGGYVEHVGLPDGLHLFCNTDEGQDLKLNRAVKARPWVLPEPPFVIMLGRDTETPAKEILSGYHLVRGDFFISRVDEEGATASLTDADLKLLGVKS